MTSALSVEDYYQAIGQGLLDASNDKAGKALLYVEAEDGVFSADVFYERSDGSIRFRFAPESLGKLAYAFWEHWASLAGNSEWGAMAYLLDGDDMKIDLVYPEQMDPDEDSGDRRLPVVQSFFGHTKVDYTHPD